jgi:hypothetical protein
MGEIIEVVNEFYKNLSDKKAINHRYRSWEHCYNFFRNIKNKELSATEWELAQIHLVFFCK